MLAAVLIASTTLVRLWFVTSGQLDLVQDEAQYWDWSRRLQLSYYSKGPLIAWLIAGWTSLLGHGGLGVRAGAVFNSCLVQVLLYLGLARGMGRPRTALWTLIALNSMPLFLASAVLMTTDSPLLVCWTGAVFCLYQASVSRRRRLWLSCLLLCVALGVLAKYMMLAFAATALLYLLGLRRAGLLPAGLVLGVCIALALGALLGLTPIALWNMDNGWVGFRHVAGLAGLAQAKPTPLLRLDTFPEFLGAQLGLLTPWWFACLAAGVWSSLKVVRTAGVQTPAARNVTARASLRPESGEVLGPREVWLFLAGFAPLFLFFMLWSFHVRIYPNWPGMAYVTGAMLAGNTLALFLGRQQAQGRALSPCRRPALWLGLAGLTFVLLHGQNWIPLPATINPTMRLKGFADLGEELGRLQNAAFQDPGRVFYFSDSYDMTAELSYYGPGRPRAFCGYFDKRRMNQYDLWPGPEDKPGWDALYVEKGFAHSPPEPLLTLFAEVRLLHYRSHHRGRPARPFTIVVCRNFSGSWPRVERKIF